MLTVSCVAWQLARMRTYKHVWVRSINWGDRLARKTPREAWGKAWGGGGMEGAGGSSLCVHNAPSPNDRYEVNEERNRSCS